MTFTHDLRGESTTAAELTPRPESWKNTRRKKRSHRRANKSGDRGTRQKVKRNVRRNKAREMKI